MAADPAGLAALRSRVCAAFDRLLAAAQRLVMLWLVDVIRRSRPAALRLAAHVEAGGAEAEDQVARAPA